MRARLARLRTRLDRRTYRALFGLYRGLLRPPRWEGPLDPKALRRVLLVRHDRLGDAIVTTPLLALLRAALPHAEIDVVASPGNRAIFEGDARVSHVHVADEGPAGTRRLARTLRRRGYDAVFSLIFGRGLREGLFAARVSAPHTVRISVHRPARYAGLFSVSVRAPRSRAHMADRLLHVGAATLKLPAAFPPVTLECWPMRLAEDPAAERRADERLAAWHVADFVLVNCWAAEPWREWPVVRCAETLCRLRARHPELVVALAPPPGREEDAEAIRAQVGAGVHVAPPSPRFADVVALARRARIVVTPDTSLVHVASACARPVLALYTGRTVDPQRWLPVGVPWRALTADGHEPIASLEPAAIVEAFEELLAEVQEL